MIISDLSCTVVFAVTVGSDKGNSKWYNERA